MAKKLTSKQKKEQLNNLFVQYNIRLGKLYSSYVKQLMTLGYDESVLEGDALFNFDNFPQFRERLNDIFKDYYQSSLLCYRNGMTDGVALAFSHDTNVLGAFSVLSDKAIRSVRDNAAATFIKSRFKSPKGLSLAQTVWNYCQQTKSEFEMAMSNVIADGIKGGISAEELGRKLRSYLNNPDMMYRRYHTVKALKNGKKKDVVTWRRRRVIDGKVRFVEEPLEKVGTGVYRSARKNAFRLARTEINAAYLRGHNERWRNEPFVIGQYIHVSPQHVIDDICNELEGRYPKDFIFASWHPSCLCTSDPIMITGKEKDEFYRRLYAGEDMSGYVSPFAVTDTPEQYRRYIEGNEDAIMKAFRNDKLAWHLADNKKYWQRFMSPENRKEMGLGAVSSKERILQAAEEKYAKRDAKAIQKAWTARRRAIYEEKMGNILDTLTYTDYHNMYGAFQKRYADVLLAVQSDKHNSVANVERLYNRFVQGAQIRERWDRLVWDGFSKEQIANCREIERLLGIRKGRPMNISLADRQSANPNYYKGEPYTVNCATCSPAYALREMGFNLVAKGNPQIEGNLNYWMSLQHSFDVWKNADGTPSTPFSTAKWMRSKGYGKLNPKRFKEFINDCCTEDGTYIITVNWKGKNGGHATILKKLKDGRIVYIEPQVFSPSIGEIRDISEICDNVSWAMPSYKKGILRVDDKLFDTDYLGIFDY